MFCRDCGIFLKFVNQKQEVTKSELSEKLESSQLTINQEIAKEVAIILFNKFNSAEGIFGYNVMPEDALPIWNSDLTNSGIKRGSYEHLMFITMVVSIDYQRNADQLWDAGRKTFENEQTRWLFNPEMVVNKSYDETLESMKIHKLSKKPQKDADIWFRVSKSFLDIYDSNPMNLIKECDYDAFRIYKKKFDPTFKRCFPYFSGDKIFPLWIRMLHDNVGLELRNLNQIPIPVDVHIARATLSTSCLTGKYLGTISSVSSKVDETWKKTMELIEHPKLKYKLQLDEPLWHLSRHGCRLRGDYSCPNKIKCPVSKFCVNGVVNVSTKGVEVNTTCI